MKNCKSLLERCERKSFLHPIVTCNEEWVYYRNSKRQKASVLTGKPGLSTSKRSIHALKVVLCIWWDQEGTVYHELLKPYEQIKAARYKQRMMKRSIEKKAVKVCQTSWQTNCTQWLSSHSEWLKWYEDIEKWIASKSKDFYWRGRHWLRERWAMVVASEVQYFE